MLLILDGHLSLAIELLEIAKENDIFLFCLPSQRTQAQQPLDRIYFKTFKTFYANETKNFAVTHEERKINRLVGGKLVGKAWIRAARSANTVSGFRAYGIYPFNPTAVSDALL